MLQFFSYGVACNPEIGLHLLNSHVGSLGCRLGIKTLYLAQLIDNALLCWQRRHCPLQECEDLLPIYVSCCGDRQFHLLHRLTVTTATT